MDVDQILSKPTQKPKRPSLSQWKQIFRVLNKKEKIFFSVLLFLFSTSLIFILSALYLNNTVSVAAKGGVFNEGLIGHPRFINPIYSEISDIDRDLSEIVFAGLMKYNPSGELIPELAERYETLQDGKIFKITLKNNLFWQDGEKLTADDVIFTIETIQNPDYKSPLRASWVGVEVKKISDSTIQFTLREPSVVFLENLTLKILPMHIWEKIQPEQFPLSIYNLNPIGSGPYKLRSAQQDRSGYIRSMTFIKNKYYFDEEPNLNKIVFKFYNTEEDLIKAARRKEIEGFSLLNPENLDSFNRSNFQAHSFSLSRYFAVFFNLDNSENLSNQYLRQALNYGTDKERIINTALKQQGKTVDSPILPELYGFGEPKVRYEFDIDKAKELLDKAGFVETSNDCPEENENDTNCGKIIRAKTVKRDTISKFKSELKLGSQGTEVRELQRCLANPPVGGKDIYPEEKITGSFDQATENAVSNFQEKYAKEILEPWGFTEGTGLVSKTTREKLNELCDLSGETKTPLKIKLTTVDYPSLIEVANNLKEQWLGLGINLEVEVLDLQTIEKETIKNRKYEALLFGEVLSPTPDPLPFWHSLQKKDPGSNLSLYENKSADKLLEEIRKSFNKEERMKKLEEFQDVILDDAPAIFLYSQDYIYLVEKSIKGIDGTLIPDPSKRLSNITDWYIRSKRTWK